MAVIAKGSTTVLVGSATLVMVTAKQAPLITGAKWTVTGGQINEIRDQAGEVKGFVAAGDYKIEITLDLVSASSDSKQLEQCFLAAPNTVATPSGLPSVQIGSDTDVLNKAAIFTSGSWDLKNADAATGTCTLVRYTGFTMS